MPASQRVLVSPFGLWMWIKQAANIRRTREVLGVPFVCSEGIERNKGRRETEPVSAPSPPFAKEIKRFRAICLDVKREVHIRARVTGCRPLFPGVDYVFPPFHPAKILECETREKLRAVIEARSDD